MLIKVAKKIKVLHLLSSNQFSGAENMVCQIINMFKNTEIEMVYCSPNGKISSSLKERNVAFLPVKKSSLKEINRVVKAFNPDIIHAHDIRASIISSIVGKNSKIISHIHGNHENMRVSNAKTILYKYASRDFNKIFWVSKSSFRDYKYKKHIERKSSILPNILDIKELKKKLCKDTKEYPYEIVYVGRMTYAKNPFRLIDVLELVIKKNPSIKIAIVGDGELSQSVKEYTIEKKIEKNIDFVGFLENPVKIIGSAKVMVLTSIYEGTPMCALEAMSLGVPIVSTPTDGLIDLISHGETGFISETNEALSEYILKIVNNELLKKEMSNSSFSKSFVLNDVENYKKKLMDVYYE